jgi:hypothetical protein
MSPNVIKITKLRKIKCGGNVERIELKGLYTEFLWKSQKARDQERDLGADDGMI